MFAAFEHSTLGGLLVYAALAARGSVAAKLMRQLQLNANRILQLSDSQLFELFCNLYA